MEARLAFWMLEAQDRLAQVLRRDEGQSAVEYGVILALILAASVIVIGVLGGRVNKAYTDICNSLTSAGVPC